MKKAIAKLNMRLVKNILVTKEDRNAIIDSMNDTSFSKSFIRSKKLNTELQSFKDYEKCVTEQRMSDIE